MNVLPCANGMANIQWCCDQGSAGCCGSASDMLLGRLYAWPVDHDANYSAGTSTVASSITTLDVPVTGTAATSSANRAATTTPAVGTDVSTSAAASSSSSSETIGLSVGLGVGIGVVIDSGDDFLHLLRERKRRMLLEKQIQAIDKRFLVQGFPTDENGTSFLT